MKINKFLIVFFQFNCLFGYPKGVKHLSSYPFISGDTFRNIADYIYDHETKNIEPKKIKNGHILFVYGNFIGDFFEKFHKKIHAKYILITHNSLKHMPGEYSKYLDDDNLAAWFGKNIISNHPKLHRIPLGIANRCWPHGNISIFQKCIEEIYRLKQEGSFKWHEKLVYVNMALETHKIRYLVNDILREQDFCFFASRKNIEAFLMEMSRFKFVASPRGAGIDCHRTWEAMLVGSIPIVKSTGLDPLFEDLPVLIIDDWNQVNKSFLEQKWIEINSREYNLKKLYADYWINMIKDLSKKLKGIS